MDASPKPIEAEPDHFEKLALQRKQQQEMESRQSTELEAKANQGSSKLDATEYGKDLEQKALMYNVIGIAFIGLGVLSLIKQVL